MSEWFCRNFGSKVVALVSSFFFGVFVILSVFVGSYVDSALPAQDLGFFSFLALYTASTLIAPAFFSGVFVPSVTMLTIDLGFDYHKVISRFHSLSAVGSIIGTIFAGFVMLPSYGSSPSVLAIGAAAILWSLFFWSYLRKRALSFGVTLLVAPFLFLALPLAESYGSKECDIESAMNCITIKDGPRDYGRALYIDGFYNSVRGYDGGLNFHPSNYVSLAANAMRRHLHNNPIDDERLYFTGGGGFELPYYAHKHLSPRHDIHVSEVDRGVVEAVDAYMGGDTGRYTIDNKGAVMSIKSLNDNSMGHVMIDVKNGVVVPPSVAVSGFFEEVHRVLDGDGFMAMNVVDEVRNPMVAKSIAKTVSLFFDEVSVWSVSDAEDRRGVHGKLNTYLVVGEKDLVSNPISSKERLELSSGGGYSQEWTNLYSGSSFKKDGEILKEGYAPTESMAYDLIIDPINGGWGG